MCLGPFVEGRPEVVMLGRVATGGGKPARGVGRAAPVDSRADGMKSSGLATSPPQGGPSSEGEAPPRAAHLGVTRRDRPTAQRVERGRRPRTEEFGLEMRWSEFDDDGDDDEDIRALMQAFTSGVRPAGAGRQVRYRTVDGDYFLQPQEQPKAPA
eukprot:CAMPEP_0170310916 /NCGR_PEP_ID=MMETSP0116_2-20130129/55951_1 /TAXON_ID=400756 /ORGANISM="Durinskia baltica, Strain CSIRO CS-38" /LENGTH=154 /DNA_ID=CAMNT_0010563205 /DNA_START=1 /DNA_END=461 /DNA_ORIENTATION=+